ncbi:MAG: DNA topoisomerase 3 [Thermoleophilia bacterium]|nr:DNA topoisomerase 3 [Thermoleophilia bacterium]
MSKTLIVAEKPSVGRDISDALPGTWEKKEGFFESEDRVVTWAVGHLVELSEPEDYDPALKKWRVKDLPIIPGKNGVEAFKLKPRSGDSEKQLKIIHRLARRDDVEKIINACDAGREGELIFAYTMAVSGVDKPTDRLWISSMTKKAIRDGFDNLKTGAEMKNLEHSARSRSEADWLVGMNATRAATIRGRSAFGGVVSIGRVQTPTLGILAAREQLIADFVPETYYLIQGEFATVDPTGRAYSGIWFDPAKPKSDNRSTWAGTLEEATERVARMNGVQGVVQSTEIKKRTVRPELLFDLTSLQRTANSRFGYSARRTLGIAQSLYEQHKVLTYPRTDSRYLTTDMVPELQIRAANLASVPMFADAANFVVNLTELPLERIVNDEKVNDHHAIIPTEQVADFNKLKDDERRIYELVVRRYLAAFHPAAKHEDTVVVTEVQGEHFRTKGSVLVFPGWRSVFGLEADAPQAEIAEGAEAAPKGDEDEKQQLPKLNEGEAINAIADAEQPQEKATKPPARYSEGTLLSAMETAGKLVDDEAMREAMKDGGLGTPATRASIIELLIGRQYIQREGRALRVTGKGMKLIEILEGHPLISPDLTGNWEKQLGEIEHGKLDAETFMKSIVDFTEKTVALITEIDKDKLKMARAELGPCPRCLAAGTLNDEGEPNIIRENARAYGCTSWKSREEAGCGFVIWRSIAGRQLMPDEAMELITQRHTTEELQGFRSRAGKSFRARLKLDDDDKVVFDFPELPEGQKRWPKKEDGEAAAAAPAEGATDTDAKAKPKAAAKKAPATKKAPAKAKAAAAPE